MRVGFDVAKAFGPRDGIASYTVNLLSALAARAETCGDRFSLHLYAVGIDAEPEQWDQALGDLPASAVRHPGRHPAQDDLDLFHTTSFTDPGFFAGPVLFTIHDLTFLSHPQFHLPTNRAHCLLATLRAVWQGATLLVDSQATADEVGRWFVVARERLRVVYPAASPVFVRLGADELTDARRRISDRFGLDGSFVLSVATFEPRKNLSRLIEAYLGIDESLRQKTPLVLVGSSGWKQESTLSSLLDSAPPGSVLRLGSVEESELIALYNCASVVAYPSLVEGFGLPVLEAMACGAPVLTSNVSSLAEVAAAAALCVDPLDPIAIRTGLEMLLHDRSLRRRYREAGLARAADFSWETAVEQVVDLYDEARIAADLAAPSGRPEGR